VPGIRVDERPQVAPVHAQGGAEVVEGRADGEPAEKVGAKLRPHVDGEPRSRRVPDALLDELGRRAHAEAVGDGACIREAECQVGGVERLACALLAVLRTHGHLGHAEHREGEAQRAEAAQVEPHAKVVEVDVGQPLAVGREGLALLHARQAGGVPVERRAVVDGGHERSAQRHRPRPNADLQELARGGADLRDVLPPARHRQAQQDDPQQQRDALHGSGLFRLTAPAI
jgi:hypothetical protein